MGGWKLEAGRFLVLVGFPVVSFWAFNQPGIFDYFMKGYKIPEAKEGEKLRVWKEEMMDAKRKRDYEKFLREQMQFEEDRRVREENRI